MLLEGLAREEKPAVEKIYRDNFPIIKSLVINNNGNEEDAADLFQEAMIVLFEKSKSEDFELTCQIRTYLYSVCRRLWLKKLQASPRMHLNSTDEREVVAVDEDLEFHEQRQVEFDLMEGALQKIGEPCKSLLEAFYMQKKQMNEIAELFGYTNSDNAKTQKYKCLGRLRKLFFTDYKSGGNYGK